MSDALIEAVARGIYGRAAARMGSTKPWSLLTSSQQITWLSDARAALAAIEAQGFRIVPVEPTNAMEDAAYAIDKAAWPVGLNDIWRAMLSAAPKLTEGT